MSDQLAKQHEKREQTLEDTLEEKIQKLKQLQVTGLTTEAEYDEREEHLLQSSPLDDQLRELTSQRQQQQKQHTTTLTNQYSEGGILKAECHGEGGGGCHEGCASLTKNTPVADL